jgi:hypothetical protein
MENLFTNTAQAASLLGATPPTQQAAIQQAIQQILADPSQMTTITGQNRGGSNAWLWQPTEQNTKYQAYNFGGENNYMTGEVAKYLKALGYSGNLASGGNISDADAQAVNAFLQDRGLSVQTGTHQVPGASQHTGIQRIIDANGVPVAVDARNNRYDGNDRLTDVAKAGALAAAAYGAYGLLGGGSGAGAATGATGTGAGAGAGAAAGAGELTTLANGVTFGAPGAGSAAFALPGAAASGGSVLSLGAPTVGFGGAAGLGGLAGGSAAFALPAATGGGGLLASLGTAGKVLGNVGSAIGGLSSAVGGAGNLAALAGGVLGATQGGKDTTATTTNQIDPRMAQYLYGSGYGDKQSLLGAAQDWWKNNQSGMNANMTQGLDMLKSLYTSPGYSQGYTQMRDVGQGLLGRPIAGNPFTQGGLLGAPGQQQALMPRPEIGVPPQMAQQPMPSAQPMPSPDIGLPQMPRRPWSI